MSQTDQLAINRIANAVEKIAKKGGGGGGGSTVTITPTLQSGTKIADYEIDGEGGSLYAPSGGSGGGAGYTAIVTVTEVMDSNGGDNNG